MKKFINKTTYVANNKYGLTEDEYELAQNLIIKLPNGKCATGDEALRMYKESKDKLHGKTIESEENN